MSIVFQDKVYLFTTECINGYMNELDVSGKSVLTVGSSGDQAFNSLLYGANDVSIIDISKQFEKFITLKKKIILNSSYDKFYDNLIEAVMSNNIDYFNHCFSRISLEKMSPYMKDEESFEKLKEILKNTDFNFINGNIYELDKFIDKKYQRIIFSNALQYINCFLEKITFNEFVSNSFKSWNNFLTEDGIIQLMYLYGVDVRTINSSLDGYTMGEFFRACGEPILGIHQMNEDLVLFYDKKLQLKK